MVTNEWFCHVMGSEVGPLSQRQLVDMVRQHQLNPEDLVRRNSSDWVPAFEVKGLFEAAAKPPAPAKSAAPANPAPPAKSETAVSEQAVKEAGTEGKHKNAGTDERESEPAASEKCGDPTVASDDSKDDWFCIATGEKRGPLGFEELKAMASDGTLRGRDRVWRASWPKFQKAAEVEGLDIPK